MEQPRVLRKPVPAPISPSLPQSPSTKTPTTEEGNVAVSLLSESESGDRETDRSGLKNAQNEPSTTQRDSDHGAHRRHLSQHLSPMVLLGDCASVVLPLGLLGFVIRVWYLDNREYTRGSLDTWHGAITVLATAFPILFAAIVGRLMTAAAHWKLGRGAEVGLLETLLGSRTVGSTVSTVLRLRTWTFGAAGLLALWTASPLGAQAFLRMLSTEQRVESEERTIAYFDGNSEFNQGAAISPFDRRNWDIQEMRVFVALMLSSPTAKASPMDLWGNIKIPFLGQTDDSKDDDPGSIDGFDGWQLRAAPSEDHEEYTSLIGVPVPARFPAGNTSFQLESTYVDLECSAITIEGDPPEIELLDTYNDSGPSGNGTWSGPCRNTVTGGPRPKPGFETELGCYSWWRLALDTFMDDHWSALGSEITPAIFDGEENVETRETRLLFYARSPDIMNEYPLGRAGSLQEASEDEDWDTEKGSFSTVCRVRQKYVHSDIECIRNPNVVSDTSPLNCQVARQRESTKPPHPPADISFLSHPNVFEQLASKVPDQGSNTFMWGLDPTLHHLFGSSGRDASIDMTQVSEADFGRRLTQLINTYIAVSQLRMDATTGNFSSPNWNLSTTAQTQWFVEYVDVSRLWIGLCILACIVLLLCGILSVVFTHWAHVPEVLGYVSSSVRDSRLVDVPPELQSLDGLDAARRIWRYRIRWGAVNVDAINPNDDRVGSNVPLLGIGRQEAVGRVKA